MGVSYGCNQWVYLIKRLNQLSVEGSVDNHFQRRDFLSLYPAFLSVAFNHGYRGVSELFGGEGHEVVEEMWRVWVSDRHSFSRVPDRHSPFTLWLPQNGLILCAVIRRLSDVFVLTVVASRQNVRRSRGGPLTSTRAWL